MKFLRNKSGVIDLILRTHLMIWIPTSLLLLCMHLSLHRYISQLTSQASQAATSNGALETTATPTLRLLAQPFTHSLKDDTLPAYIGILRDFEALWVLAWLSIVVFSTFSVFSVLKRIYFPLGQMREAVDRLAAGDLNQPIVIEGSATVEDMSETLERMRRRLIKNEKNQMQFLRHISHEIKTPLTSIKEGAKLLEDEILGPISEEQREITAILNKSTSELQGSIENLLNFNSAISVNIIKKRHSVELKKLINDAIKKQALAIRTKHIDIDLRINNPHIRAFVDPSQLTTVFENLLSNAIKFSPYNGVITLYLSRSGNNVEFTIQDDGPGIPIEQRTAVFSAFYVGTQVTQNPLKGTGLGLSIVKEYVELHGGTIEVIEPSDNEQTGACFQIILKG